MSVSVPNSPVMFVSFQSKWYLLTFQTCSVIVKDNINNDNNQKRPECCYIKKNTWQPCQGKTALQQVKPLERKPVQLALGPVDCLRAACTSRFGGNLVRLIYCVEF